jgi:hypothetical protein
MKIVLSSGHGKYVRGASGYLDEVDEARRVVNKVAELLNSAGVHVEVFHDDVSHSQNENLNRIVGFHNSESRELDVSVHFNAYEITGSPMGCEVLYLTQKDLAQKVATAICNASGLKNRGPKKRTDLFFLNNTTEPAILIETCFVDSMADADIYDDYFQAICAAIAQSISDVEHPAPPEASQDATFTVSGRASTFGGPNDTGVSPNEGLAFISRIEEAPQLFLPYQPPQTTGLARRLNPFVHYLACRWDYSLTPKTTLRDGIALVKATKTGVILKAFPADWGPNEATGRVADLSPGLMEDLGIKTDDHVEVSFPF